MLKDTIKLKIKIDKGANKHQFQKSNPLVSSLPRKASAPIRQAIIDALKDRSRRFLDNNGPTRNLLIAWEISADGLYQDLIEGLESSDRLFLKPKDHNYIQAYQCIINYSKCGEDDAQVVVHVTLAPKGEPPRVRVAVHPSDTARTLPALISL